MYAVASMARELGVPEALRDEVGVKKRNRGASDVETALSMVYSKASGNGALSDLDAQRKDAAVRVLTGIDRMPGSRAAGRWLHHCEAKHVDQLRRVNRETVRKILPSVVKQAVESDGYVGIFIDASVYEVSGSNFEGAAKGYGEVPRYLSHCVFFGPLMVDSMLNRGDASITAGWEELLVNALSLLPKGVPALVRADNAYYSGDFVSCCVAHGVHYSVSVTNGTFIRPLERLANDLPESAWRRIGRGEDAAMIKHRPAGNWPGEQS